MFIGDGILVMLPGKAYLLFISVSSPPLAGIYGIFYCILLVSKCVLLKISLYFGKIFWMYLVDFVAVSLLSWIIIIDVLVCEFGIKSYMLGSAVFSDDAFHEMTWVLFLMFWIILGCSGGGITGGGGGCMYSIIGSNFFNVSFSRLLSRKGNLLFIVCKLGWLSS